MATYYVDPSGGNGDGSIGNPFNALPSNFSSSGFANGDVFLFKRGTTYTPSWTGSPGDAFTVNRTIRFGNYGIGPLPIISSDYSGTAGGKLFRVYSNDCVFDGLAFQNTNNCHPIYTTNALTNITVQNCTFSNIRGSDTGNEGGIMVGTATPLTGTVKILNNTLDGICNDAIEIRCTGTIEIGGNQVYNPSLDTITGDCVAVVGNVSSLWIYGNILDHSNKDTKHCIIQDQGSTGSALVENNICNGYFSSGSSSHTGIYLSLPGEIRGNIVKTWRSGVFCNTNDIRVFANVILQGSGESSTGAVWGFSSGMVAENNTIISIAGTDISDAAIRNGSATTSNVCRNNIIQGFGTGIQKGMDTVDSYNNFFNVDQPVRNSAAAAVSSGANTLFLDPNFTETYYPVNTRILRGGVDVGGGRDAYGDEYTNPPPMGAVQNPYTNNLLNLKLIANYGYDDEGTQTPEPALSETATRRI